MENLPDNFFDTQVNPVLTQRCVVCHACYDAPCQLKMSSPEGIARGANKEKVYEGTRLTAAQPNRMFLDAHNVDAWRERGFFDVLESKEKPNASPTQSSVLAQMLLLKKQHPLPNTAHLGDNFDISLNRQNQCPTIDYYKSRCTLNCLHEESPRRVSHRTHSTRIRTHSTKRKSQSPATSEKQLVYRRSLRWDQCLDHKISILKNLGFFKERPSHIQGTYPSTCKIPDYSNKLACCPPGSWNPLDHGSKITGHPCPQDNPQAVKSVAGLNFKSIHFQEPIL